MRPTLDKAIEKATNQINNESKLIKLRRQIALESE